MSLPFLVAANLILLTRLFCLFRDEPAPARVWRVKSAIEFAALLLCFPFSAPLAGALVLVALANLAGARAERRARRRNLARLLIGLVQLLGFSLLFAPGADVEFHAFWSSIGHLLPGLTTLAPLLTALAKPASQLVLFGLLLTANEANLVIRTVFDWLDLKPRAAPDARGVIEGPGKVDVGEFNRGRVIGLLERSLLYGFILQGQLGAIGFIMAAKAFARFKALDDRSFAEYVLIGTLLSGGLALALGLLVSQGLAR